MSGVCVTVVGMAGRPVSKFTPEVKEAIWAIACGQVSAWGHTNASDIQRRLAAGGRASGLSRPVVVSRQKVAECLRRLEAERGPAGERVVEGRELDVVGGLRRRILEVVEQTVSRVEAEHLRRAPRPLTVAQLGVLNQAWRVLDRVEVKPVPSGVARDLPGEAVASRSVFDRMGELSGDGG